MNNTCALVLIALMFVACSAESPEEAARNISDPAAEAMPAATGSTHPGYERE